MTQLSEHFSLGEMTRSDTATRLGIDQTPTAGVLINLQITAAGMERVRALLGKPIGVSSGYRSEELERIICDKDFRAWCHKRGVTITGKTWAEYFARKAHPQGWAADFTCPVFGPPQKIAQAIRDSALQFDQCLQEGAWVHISFAPAMRRRVMTARFVNGLATFTAGV